MNYTDCVLCPNCKHWIDIDVEIEYGGINDMSAIITPIERRKPMVSVTEVVERNISVQVTEGNYVIAILAVSVKGKSIQQVNIRHHGEWIQTPTAIDLMYCALEHKTEFDELIKEIENVTRAV